MNTYQDRATRVAFGVAAMAMSTLTIGALVVLPAHVETEAAAQAALAAAQPVVLSCVTALPDLHSGDAD